MAEPLMRAVDVNVAGIVTIDLEQLMPDQTKRVKCVGDICVSLMESLHRGHHLAETVQGFHNWRTDHKVTSDREDSLWCVRGHLHRESSAAGWLCDLPLAVEALNVDVRSGQKILIRGPFDQFGIDVWQPNAEVMGEFKSSPNPFLQVIALFSGQTPPPTNVRVEPDIERLGSELDEHTKALRRIKVKKHYPHDQQKAIFDAIGFVRSYAKDLVILENVLKQYGVGMFAERISQLKDGIAKLGSMIRQHPNPGIVF